MFLVWGVILVVGECVNIIDDMLDYVVNDVVKIGVVVYGDLVVIIVGVLVGELGVMNLMKV